MTVRRRLLKKWTRKFNDNNSDNDDGDSDDDDDDDNSTVSYGHNLHVGRRIVLFSQAVTER